MPGLISDDVTATLEREGVDSFREVVQRRATLEKRSVELSRVTARQVLDEVGGFACVLSPLVFGIT